MRLIKWFLNLFKRHRPMTITGRPNTHSAVFNPIIYTITGTANSQEDIIVYKADATVLGTLRVTYDTGGNANLDVSQILKSYLSADYTWQGIATNFDQRPAHGYDTNKSIQYYIGADSANKLWAHFVCIQAGKRNDLSAYAADSTTRRFLTPFTRPRFVYSTYGPGISISFLLGEGTTVAKCMWNFKNASGGSISNVTSIVTPGSSAGIYRSGLYLNSSYAGAKTVEISLQTSGNSKISETLIADIENCDGWPDRYTLHWVNSLGGVDSWTFTEAQIEDSIDADSKQIQLRLCADRLNRNQFDSLKEMFTTGLVLRKPSINNTSVASYGSHKRVGQYAWIVLPNNIVNALYYDDCKEVIIDPVKQTTKSRFGTFVFECLVTLPETNHAR